MEVLTKRRGVSMSGLRALAPKRVPRCARSCFEGGSALLGRRPT
jgi:hypothetical protein